MKRTYWAFLGLGIAIAAFMVLGLSPQASAWQTGSTYVSNSGDWTVSSATEIGDETVTVNGNITVNAPLTLYNAGITFTPSADNQYRLNVTSAGTLNIWGNSVVTSNNVNYHYAFTVNGTLSINYSTVSEMWGNTAAWVGGIQIYGSARVANSTIQNGKTGGICIVNGSAELFNNAITSNGLQGSTSYAYGVYIWSNGTNRVNVTSNRIYNNYFLSGSRYGYGMYSRSQVSGENIAGNDIYDNGFSTTTTNYGYGLYLLNSVPTISNNNFTNGQYQLYVSACSPLTVTGGRISGYARMSVATYGVYATGSNVTFNNVLFATTSSAYTQYGAYGTSFTTLNFTKCTFTYNLVSSYVRYLVYAVTNTSVNIDNTTMLSQYGGSYLIYASSGSPVKIINSALTTKQQTTTVYGIYAATYSPVSFDRSSFTMSDITMTSYFTLYAMYLSNNCPVSFRYSNFDYTRVNMSVTGTYSSWTIYGIYATSTSAMTVYQSKINFTWNLLQVNYPSSSYTYNYGYRYLIYLNNYCPLDVSSASSLNMSNNTVYCAGTSSYVYYTYPYDYYVYATSYCPVNFSSNSTMRANGNTQRADGYYAYCYMYILYTNSYSPINFNVSRMEINCHTINTNGNYYEYPYLYGIQANGYSPVNIIRSHFEMNNITFQLEGYYSYPYLYTLTGSSYSPVTIDNSSFNVNGTVMQGTTPYSYLYIYTIQGSSYSQININSSRVNFQDVTRTSLSTYPVYYFVYGNSYAPISIDRSTFLARNLFFNGGQMLYSNYYCPMTITNSSILNDNVTGSRSVIYNYYGALNINDTVLRVWNETPASMYSMTGVYTSQDLFQFHNFTMDINRTGYVQPFNLQGVYGQNKEGTMDRCNFTINTSYVQVSYLYYYPSLLIDNSTFNFRAWATQLNGINFQYDTATIRNTYMYFNITNNTPVSGAIFAGYGQSNMRGNLRFDNTTVRVETGGWNRTGQLYLFQQFTYCDIAIENSTIKMQEKAGITRVFAVYIYDQSRFYLNNSRMELLYGGGTNVTQTTFYLFYLQNSWGMFLNNGIIDITFNGDSVGVDSFYIYGACGAVILDKSSVSWNLNAPGSRLSVLVFQSGGGAGSLTTFGLYNNSKLALQVNRENAQLGLFKMGVGAAIGKMAIDGTEFNITFNSPSNVPTYVIDVDKVRGLTLANFTINLAAPQGSDTTIFGIRMIKTVATIDNLTINGNGGGHIIGIAMDLGSLPTLNNTKIKNVETGVMSTFFSNPVISNCDFQQCGIGLYLDNLGNASVSKTKMTQMQQGIVAVNNSYVTLVDSTIQSTVADIDLNGVSTAWLLNSVINSATVKFNDDSSMLVVNWWLKLKITWQNGAPIPEPAVALKNARGEVLPTSPADVNGVVDWFTAAEFFQTRLAKTSYSPYKVNVTYNGFSGEASITVDKSKEENIKITDDRMPVLDLLEPSDDVLQNFTSVLFRGTASDLGSGIGTVKFSHNGTSWTTMDATAYWEYLVDIPEGKWDFIVKLSDRAGNEVTFHINITIDLTRPFIVIDEPATGLLGNVIELTLKGRVEKGSTLTINLRPVTVATDGSFTTIVRLVEGLNEFTLFARDRAGNTNSTDWTASLDITPPVLKVLSPDEGMLTNIKTTTVTGTTEPGATVTIAGMAATVGADGSFSLAYTLSEGTNVITVIARDAVGNNRTLIRTVVLDSQLAVLVTEPADGTFTNQMTILARGTADTDSFLRLNDALVTVGPDGKFSVTVILAEGRNTLVFDATDRAGNTFRQEITVTLDTSSPLIDVTAPLAEKTFSTKDVTVSGSCEAGIMLTVNGLNVSTATGSFSTTVTLAEGAGMITINGADAAGNPVSVSIPVYVDLTPPTLEIVEPLDGFRTLDQSVVVVGLTEPGAHVTVNGMPVSVDAFGKFSTAIAIRKGTNPITVTSSDDAGNNVTRGITVKMVVTAPVTATDDGWQWTVSGLLVALGIMFPLTMLLVNLMLRMRRTKGGN